MYVGHLLVLAWAPDLLRRAEVLAAALSAVTFAVVVAVLSVLWLRFFPQGPLEVAIRLPRRWRARR
jgi:uncharacterized membrane protein YeiB